MLFYWDSLYEREINQKLSSKLIALRAKIKLRIHLILLKNSLKINQKFIREFEVNIFFAIFAIETTVSETTVSETTVSV